MTVRIAMWSGPRNISTAMMRSFASRADCFVSDEPFYGAFLKASGERQPLADEIIASMDCNWETIAETMKGSVPGRKPVWYQKHMPHHMVGSVSIRDFPDHRHAFLIRDPARVIASYAVKGVAVRFEYLGLEPQLAYFEAEADRLGRAPPVVEGADILYAPETMLPKLCAALDIAWDPAMLSWKKGRHPQDGIWAPHWYGRVIESTGFEGDDRGPVELPEDYRALYERCRPYYEALRRFKLAAPR